MNVIKSKDNKKGQLWRILIASLLSPWMRRSSNHFVSPSINTSFSNKRSLLQHFRTEPLDIESHLHSTAPKSKTQYEDKKSCPYSEDKILLSLVLRGRTWDELVQRKRDRAINKLAKFFMLTKVSNNLEKYLATQILIILYFFEWKP